MHCGKEGGSASGESGRRTSRGSRSLVTGHGAQSARGEVERSTASHLIVCVQKKSGAVLQMSRSGARCSDQTDTSAEHGRSRAHVIASPPLSCSNAYHPPCHFSHPILHVAASLSSTAPARGRPRPRTSPRCTTPPTLPRSLRAPRRSTASGTTPPSIRYASCWYEDPGRLPD